MKRRQRFPGGEIDARLDIQQGVIRSVKFYGDFFVEVEPEALDQLLIGVRYSQEDITRALQHEAIDRYFSGLDLQTFGAFLS